MTEIATPLRVPAQSRVWVYSTILATVNGNQAYNPTGDTVVWAFLAVTGSPPAGTTIYTGGWATGGPPYVARCLIGPGGAVSLAPGSYYAWLQITDNPEIPWLPAGVIEVY